MTPVPSECECYVVPPKLTGSPVDCCTARTRPLGRITRWWTPSAALVPCTPRPARPDYAPRCAAAAQRVGSARAAVPQVSVLPRTSFLSSAAPGDEIPLGSVASATIQPDRGDRRHQKAHVCGVPGRPFVRTLVLRQRTGTAGMTPEPRMVAQRSRRSDAICVTGKLQISASARGLEKESATLVKRPRWVIPPDSLHP